MNTYLYAPKDDVKHRAYWRDLYTVEEAGRCISTTICVSHSIVASCVSYAYTIFFSSKQDVTNYGRPFFLVSFKFCIISWFLVLHQCIKFCFNNMFSESLTELIQSANKHDLTFVYAISPGLDITYSSNKDLTILRRKLDQVKVLMLRCKSV